MDWIKCTDRMPPDMEPVMVTLKDMNTCVLVEMDEL